MDEYNFLSLIKNQMHVQWSIRQAPDRGTLCKGIGYSRIKKTSETLYDMQNRLSFK